MAIDLLRNGEGRLNFPKDSAVHDKAFASITLSSLYLWIIEAKRLFRKANSVSQHSSPRTASSRNPRHLDSSFQGRRPCCPFLLLRSNRPLSAKAAVLSVPGGV